jgi:uncharacterized cupredoxin-like copper-binding protein
MFRASPSTAARVVTAGLAALLLGACGGGTTTTTTPSAGSSAAPVGTSVGVVEKEYTITLDKATFTPGTYTFKVSNQGSFSHNLTIEGPGVDQTTSPTVGGGQSGTLTVALQKGSYELWCSIDSHKDKGMDTHITVG